MAVLHSAPLYIILPWLYIQFTLLDSILFYHGSTSLYFTLQYFTMALLDSTLIYHGSTSMYVIVQYSTMVLLHST